MTRDEIVEILARDNPKAKLDSMNMYADAFLQYREASANIAQYGNVVAHPRTGTPLPNPYLPILAAARKAIESHTRLKTDSLWLASPIPQQSLPRQPD